MEILINYFILIVLKWFVEYYLVGYLSSGVLVVIISFFIIGVVIFFGICIVICVYNFLRWGYLVIVVVVMVW